MVMGKWTTLTRDCNKFTAIVDKHSWLSGENDSTWLARCYKTFAETWGFAIIHYEAWNVLKNHHIWRGVKAVVPERRIHSKTHIVGGVSSGEYMDLGFTKSMLELDRCYTMLQELRFVIVGGELIHKNCKGSKRKGKIIRLTICDFGGNCESNQSPFNDGRIEEWEAKKKDRVSTTKFFHSKILINNLRKSIEDKVRREKVFKVNETLNIENSRASSLNNKMANVFQEEDELEYVETLDGEAKQVTYDVQRTLCSPKALVKAFKLLTEPHLSPYQIGRIKKELALKVTEICKVPLAIGKHYNELVTFDVVDIETKLENMTLVTLVTLVASLKEFQAKKKEKGVSYTLVVKGVEDVMENTMSEVIKPLLAEFGKIVTDDRPGALPSLRNIQHQIDLSRKTSLLVSISSEVLGFDSIMDLHAIDEGFGNIWMELETKQHREEQHLMVPCSDEEILKFPTQHATTKISGENGSNLEDFFIVLTREEADIIGPIMAVDDEPFMILES
nr:hypothetical protein [Tanacetum cinerariifolium]